MPIFARAPLRLSFAGGGTDTPAYASRYGGLVLSAGIARYVTVRGETGNDQGFHSYPEDETDPSYLAKVAAQFKVPVSLEARIDAPPRSGLGGSGALGVAAFGCMRRLTGQIVSKDGLAEQAFRFETEVMKNAGGRQDQYAAAFGGLNLLVFKQNGETAVISPEISRDTLLALESSLVMVFIHARAGASGKIMTEEAEAVARGDKQVLDALTRQKLLASEMAKALKEGDLVGFGRMLGEAWEQKKRQAFEVSNDVVDGVYSLARKSGALGGKLTGAGGGGYIFFVAPERAGPVAEALRAVGLRPENVVFVHQGFVSW